MSKTNLASVTATTNPLNAEIQTRFFRATRTKKSVRTGSAETAVDSARFANGSYSCDQDIPALAYLRGRYVLLNSFRFISPYPHERAHYAIPARYNAPACLVGG
jgi:hypothetical protein